LPEAGCDLDSVLGEVERRLILQALERSGGVRTTAAKSLGVTLRSLRYRMQKLALQDDDEEPVSMESWKPES
jgi:two-component system response regulator PilR (NtrC family)